MFRSSVYLLKQIVKFKSSLPEVSSVLFNVRRPQFNVQNVKQCLARGNSASFATAAMQEPECDFAKLTNGDPELEKRLKIIMLEIEVMRQDGELVPDVLKSNHWTELLLLKSRSQRQKFLTFLFKNERTAENKRRKKLEERLQREEATQSHNDDGHIRYGLGHNTIFFRIYDTKMDEQLNNKLIQAMQFSEDLVVDCSYERHMTRIELKNCAKQLMFVFADNRVHVDPFNLQFCNLDPNGELLSILRRNIPTMSEPYFPFNVTHKSYLDLYPKERLVYLTPHCREDLKGYDPEDVYIVGAMVDKANNEPLSMARAKEQGIRVARFPLDRMLLWGLGSKSLTINAALSIMLDLRLTNDWAVALRHVPKRKLVQEKDLLDNENHLKKRNLLYKMDSPNRRRFSVKSLYDE